MSSKVNVKYRKIADSILWDIESGLLSPGEQLATEMELTKRFNVSRVTVRRALEMLTENGYLVRKVGKGTFICDNIVRKQLNEIVSFSASRLLRGERPSTQLFFLKLGKADKYARKMLNISANKAVYSLGRLRLSNDYPVLYEEAYLVKDVVGTITEQQAATSLFDQLKRKISFSHAVSDYDAIAASGDIAEKLGVKEGFPLLRAITTFYAEGDIPFELSINYHRTDRIKLSFDRVVKG